MNRGDLIDRIEKADQVGDLDGRGHQPLRAGGTSAVCLTCDQHRKEWGEPYQDVEDCHPLWWHATVRYEIRARANGYLVEAVTDDGTAIQSELLDDAVVAVDIFMDFRSRAMVQRVRIIAAHTGEVLVDLPSRAATVKRWSSGPSLMEPEVGTVRAVRVEVNR